MDQLSPQIIEKILSHLDPIQLQKCMLVCRSWLDLINTSRILMTPTTVITCKEYPQPKLVKPKSITFFGIFFDKIDSSLANLLGPAIELIFKGCKFRNVNILQDILIAGTENLESVQLVLPKLSAMITAADELRQDVMCKQFVRNFRVTVDASSWRSISLLQMKSVKIENLMLNIEIQKPNLIVDISNLVRRSIGLHAAAKVYIEGFLQFFVPETEKYLDKLDVPFNNLMLICPLPQISIFDMLMQNLSNNLKTLNINLMRCEPMPADYVTCVLKHMAGLKSLFLNTDETGLGSFLENAHRLVNLKKLGLSVKGEGELDISIMVSKLPLLNYLQLMFIDGDLIAEKSDVGPTKLQAIEVTCRKFNAALSVLAPNLTHLKIDDAKIISNIEDFPALEKLESLHLSETIIKEQIIDKKLIFPTLRVLIVSYEKDSNQFTIHFQAVRKLFPLVDAIVSEFYALK